MKKTGIILIIALSLVLFNCKRDSNNSSVVSTHMDISYLDKLGKDLLNPLVSGYFAPGDIHVYTLTGNVKAEVNNERMTYPHDFMIYKNEELNRYFIRFFLEADTVIVKLNESISDTLTCVIDKSNGNQILRKFWYNHKLEWEFGIDQKITIIK